MTLRYVVNQVLMFTRVRDLVKRSYLEFDSAEEAQRVADELNSGVDNTDRYAWRGEL